MTGNRGSPGARLRAALGVNALMYRHDSLPEDCDVVDAKLPSPPPPSLPPPRPSAIACGARLRGHSNRVLLSAVHENVQWPNEPHTPQWHSSTACPCDEHHASHPGGAGWGGDGGDGDGDEPPPCTHDGPPTVVSSAPVHPG